MPKYINLLTDFAFKFIFANENNKEILIDFLNSIMAFQNVYVQDLTYKNTEFSGQNEEDRKVIIDLLCVNEKGEHFIIEVQRAKQKYFKKRILFYASRLIQDQGIKDKDWNYDFKGVYTIAILEFSISDNEQIINTYRILNETTHQIYLEDFGIILVSLDKFRKNEEELENNFDRWMYLLKNLHKLDSMPLKLQNKLFIKLFQLAEYSAMDKEKQNEYLDSLMKYNELKNTIDTYKEEVEIAKKELEQERRRAEQERERAEQKEKELEQERERAEQERERAEQERERAEQEKIRAIRILYSLGLSNQEIANKTGYDLDFVNRITSEIE